MLQIHKKGKIKFFWCCVVVVSFEQICILQKIEFQVPQASLYGQLLENNHLVKNLGLKTTATVCRNSLLMFFKISVLKNFHKFHRNTPVLESLSAPLLKRDSNTGVFL